MSNPEDNGSKELSHSKGLYGPYSFTVHKIYHTENPQNCLDTTIISRKCDISPSQLIYLHRLLSLSVLQGHPNFLKVISVYQSTPKTLKDTILTQFYAEFDYRVGSLRPRIPVPSLDDLLSFQIRTPLHGSTLETWLTTSIPPCKTTQAKIIHGILDGVKFLHSKTIHHGSLNARNVVFAAPKFELPVKIGFLHEARRPHEDIHSLGGLFFAILESPWRDSTYMTESIFLWLVEKEPLKNRMILNGDYILSKMVEEDDHERFQSVEEIRIELDTGSELFDNSNITTVLQQLKNPDGTEWFRNATFFNPLGQGAFGFVTEARNEQTGQVTAVKVLICPDTETDIGAQKEYNNIKFTYHRNLVRTHQIRETVVELEELRNLKGALTSGSDAQFDSMMSRLYEEKEDQDVNDGLVKLVCLEMELCGQTLAEWLQSGKKRDDPSRTVLIIQDIFDGIGFLHGKNILHRDLKPANILFSPGESLPVKIADFGLSRKICDGMHQSCSSGQGIDETAVFSTSVGTPIYRAPEVATGTYGTPADLYSLGFILWEILCQISPKQKSLLFQRLKNKDSTVLDSDQANSIISNGAEIIISLTQEQVVERPLSITEIKLVTHPGIRFTPEDTFQLKTFLKCGGPGARVELGRVLCHKTSLNNRQDTMMVEWNLTNNRKTSTKSGYNLEAGCLIKGTEPDELNGFDIKLVGIKASESLVGKQYFRFLYINLQESCNCPDVTKGWIYPTSSLQYISNQDLAHDKFELSGVTDFRGKIETIKTDDGIGRDDRKVVIVVNFDACLLGLRGDDADFNGVGCINNLEDVIRKHSLSVAIQGEAYIILK